MLCLGLAREGLVCLKENLRTQGLRFQERVGQVNFRYAREVVLKVSGRCVHLGCVKTCYVYTGSQPCSSTFSCGLESQCWVRAFWVGQSQHLPRGPNHSQTASETKKAKCLVQAPGRTLEAVSWLKIYSKKRPSQLQCSRANLARVPSKVPVWICDLYFYDCE